VTERDNQDRAKHHDQRAKQTTSNVALLEVAVAEINGNECRELEERERVANLQLLERLSEATRAAFR